MSYTKTALVLSAGGMFGAYQAGAFRAIRSFVKPDIVVGASAGALNAFLIASECTPEHLIERWLDPSIARTLRLDPNAGWRRGRLDPAPLRAQTATIFAQYRPRVPLGIVVVEFPGFRRRLIRDSQIRAEHLLATCSIPLFLPAVKIDGTRCIDGGLFEKLPVWAALEMGANRIVAVDALPDVDGWWIHAVMAAARVFAPRRRFPAGLEIVTISPPEALGGVKDAVFWKRENIARWIDLGERDAGMALRAAPVRAA